MASTTTGLSTELSIYYDKIFLERADKMTVYDIGARMKTIPANGGKTISWSRRTPLAAATTPLTEATTPSAVDMTTSQVSASIAPYGNYTKAGQLYSLTSIDEGLAEHVEVHAANAAFTIDTLIRNELDDGGTAQLANGVAALTDLAASDTFDGAEVRKAVRTLKLNSAPAFSGGRIAANHYGGIIPVSVAHDLRGDSEWLDAYKYTDAENLRNGLIGRIHGVEFFETNNEMLTADAGSGNVDEYKTFIFGEDAYAAVWLQNQPGSRIFVKNPGPNDTSNPLDMFSTVGWKAHYATKVLNSNWLIEVSSASSVGANS